MTQESQEPFMSSDLYEYTLHDETDNTLQVFTTHTMSSTYFSAKQTLDLLNFLQANRDKLETLATKQHKQHQKRRTTQERIDDLFS